MSLVQNWWWRTTTEVQDGQAQEGESERETRLRILEVESASQKAGSCGKAVEEDMRQHRY